MEILTDAARRRRSRDVLQSKVVEVANKSVRGPAVGEGVTPEHPLESGHGCDHDGLEEQTEGALAARETAIKQADTGDDEPDDEGAEHQVSVVKFEADIWSVDIDFKWVATRRMGWIVLGLVGVSMKTL